MVSSMSKTHWYRATPDPTAIDPREVRELVNAVRGWPMTVDWERPALFHFGNLKSFARELRRSTVFTSVKFTPVDWPHYAH